jgi:hypothetical protein
MSLLLLKWNKSNVQLRGACRCACDYVRVLNTCKIFKAYHSEKYFSHPEKCDIFYDPQFFLICYEFLDNETRFIVLFISYLIYGIFSN